MLPSACVWPPAAATKCAASGNAGEFAVVVLDLAVDDGVVDAFGELRGIRVGGTVDDGDGVENCDVREIAGFKEAAAFEMLALRGQRSNLAYSRF